MSTQAEKTMQVLIVEPGKAAYVAEIDGSLTDMQKVVNGYIQATYPYEEPVALICNEDGIFEGLPFNRALRDGNGEIYDIVVGTFFICGLSGSNFTSLSLEHMEKFKEMFYDPEIFTRIGNRIIAIKVTEEYLRRNPPPKRGSPEHT